MQLGSWPTSLITSVIGIWFIQSLLDILEEIQRIGKFFFGFDFDSDLSGINYTSQLWSKPVGPTSRSVYSPMIELKLIIFIQGKECSSLLGFFYGMLNLLLLSYLIGVLAESRWDDGNVVVKLLETSLQWSYNLYSCYFVYWPDEIFL